MEPLAVIEIAVMPDGKIGVKVSGNPPGPMILVRALKAAGELFEKKGVEMEMQSCGPGIEIPNGDKLKMATSLVNRLNGRG